MKKGRAKSILASSIDSALLAVEIYNKPRATFRTEAFISLMIIAWTRLFHCYFYQSIGDKYYYRDKKSNRYLKKDNERMAWDLSNCIKEYGNLSEAVKANLNFFILLRNKVEHRHVEKIEFDTMLFGECQALLYNFESQLIEWFGYEYCINETLAFSLQFSVLRNNTQEIANKRALSADLKDLKRFIENYRSSLSQDIFNSNFYSIKLIQIPKISNTERNDLAIKFVNWSSLSVEDRGNYEKLITIIKDKVIQKPVINYGGMKPKKIRELVEKGCEIKFSDYDHRCFYSIFKIRPLTSDKEDPFDTNTEFCNFDEVHNDYVYQEGWAKVIIQIISNGKLNRHQWIIAYKENKHLNIKDYTE
ncbi:hypothetical protein BN59_00387 [Legionella massiliensis]|uniref:DUF3644 domain-containing protein n=1 Tax=Legionella massiliensis TaxID=1034943 RepID=A0A078KSS6_9GAMM|nr:DUF3644 domain-containing protein [Legionella massiliensis]CDZ76121.1 hypothetical protein BN59_00387 [Legionella massiliensis]CEE11859.1 hypothetical protein BN1094_00387 [Legionella massiliensis]